jgi:hypothetical protein
MAEKLIAVAETPLFVRQAGAVWDEDERLEFVSFIAASPRGRRPDPGDGRRPQGAVVAARHGEAGRRPGGLFLP